MGVFDGSLDSLSVQEVPPGLRQLVEECWAADYDTRPEFEVRPVEL